MKHPVCPANGSAPSTAPLKATRFAATSRPALTDAPGALMHPHVGSEENVSFRLTKVNDVGCLLPSPPSAHATGHNCVGTIAVGLDLEKIVAGNEPAVSGGFGSQVIRTTTRRPL